MLTMAMKMLMLKNSTSTGAQPCSLSWAPRRTAP